ncbi:hypothetical protein SEA_CLEARASMUD_44 [Microbacterium phage ClearAsMud]|uniref:Uncharacterized protein n=1 Tax=Microbacterium phage ClearAsMud TaxID=2743404 RepID=A0A7G9A0W5_9CAUD|nr:hypothetical protein QDA07_gp44 [Microbacterium phage ClearAsMud]QNL30254.1 hypothetical protein SEA_CLEARASMUD_44 [Microbacterium phage ClearAsMud]
MTTELSTEDRDAIKSILTGYREDGIENPLLPMDVDVTGDGICDSWGLDADGNVIVVPGAHLDDTVFVSEGDDIGPESVVLVMRPDDADEEDESDG